MKFGNGMKPMNHLLSLIRDRNIWVTFAEFATKILESSSLQSWDTWTYSGILYWVDMILCEKKECSKTLITEGNLGGV
jgi:hypothetical protein